VEKVAISVLEIDGAPPLDVAVAAVDLEPGEVVFSIPDRLCVTLDGVFQDGDAAEVLTTDKLSELACLALYLMYEKKNGEESFWYPYIKELDRERGRGQSGVQSLLLWDKSEVESLLQGSPVLKQLAERRRSIEKEYEELDTVWFMARSLFKNYPYDIPTEAFSKELYMQAFAAIQSCVVHLQGVELSKRFALIPMGPPLVMYKSTTKSMLSYNSDTKAVELKVDRPYKAGEALEAWCGPQPNSRLLVNYGLVDECNPYDKMQMTVSIPQTDPLFSRKRSILQTAELTSKTTFNLTEAEPLPPKLLPFMRFALIQDAGKLDSLKFDDMARPVTPENEAAAVSMLSTHIRAKLSQYQTTVDKDTRIIDDPHATAKQKIAAKLLRIEKRILQGTLAKLEAMGIDTNGSGIELPKFRPEILE